jgi:SAM-dependent methyltransferase
MSQDVRALVPAASEELPSRFIQLDEDGYFKMDDLRVADLESGQNLYANLTVDASGRARTIFGSVPVFVEAFDEPIIAVDVDRGSGLRWQIQAPYEFRQDFELATLTLDEWDRFHGRTLKGVPFVFSRAAQARFFNLLDEYEDDAIIVSGTRIPTLPWLTQNPEVDRPEFWTDLYLKNETRWELGAPSHALELLVPQLKLQKSRVLVLGAGSGNDAAWFAQRGHIVTAIDFSAEAISRAQQKYGHLPTLTFKQGDIFQLPTQMNESFDLIFEHTCYCAINPERRDELMKVWRRVLVDHGHVMGVFFTMDKSDGPPYGSTEWELRSRFESKRFRSLYWTRMRDSNPRRLGLELYVYAQKIPKFAAMI